jgi:hypothetical protein
MEGTGRGGWVGWKGRVLLLKKEDNKKDEWKSSNVYLEGSGGDARSVGGRGARRINDIDDARTSQKIPTLGLIGQLGGQGAMLVKADLMIVCVAIAGNGARLPVHLLVKVDQILGHCQCISAPA